MIKSRAAAYALSALTVFAANGATAQERYSVSGQRVAVYNIVGRVRVEPTNGASVVVEVQRAGADASQLRVQTGEVRGRNAVRVIYPDDRIVYRDSGMGRFSRSDIRVRSDGTFGSDHTQQGERGWGRFMDEGRRITIAGTGSGVEAHADLRVLVPAGKDAAIYLGVGRIEAQNVNGRIQLITQSGDVTADAMGGELWIDTGSGDVEVRRITAVADVGTGSGDIVVQTLNSADLKLNTGSGDIKTMAVKVSTLRANSGSGDMRFDELSAPDATLETGSGDIDLTLTSDVQSLRANTGSGDIDLRVPQAFGAQLVIDTGSGEIRPGLPLQIQLSRESHLRATVGDGRGDVRIRTGSGDVTLTR